MFALRGFMVRPRHCIEPGSRDGLTAGFAIAEHSPVNPVQGRLGCPQEAALVLPQAHLYNRF